MFDYKIVKKLFFFVHPCTVLFFTADGVYLFNLFFFRFINVEKITTTGGHGLLHEKSSSSSSYHFVEHEIPWNQNE